MEKTSEPQVSTRGQIEKTLPCIPMSRQRDISELNQAIVPPLRWSPIAWLLTMGAIVVLGAMIIHTFRDTVTTAILLGLLGIVFVICLFWLQYRCNHAYYVNGILYRGFFHDYPILFADIESYSLFPIKKTSYRDKMMRKPDSFQYHIKFVLHGDHVLKKVTILFPEDDDRLESFFTELRNAIFRRMIACYQEEKRFDWTPHVRVLEHGVELTGRANDALARDVFIPFEELAGCKFRIVPTRRAVFANGFWRTIEVLYIILSPTSFLTGTLRTRMNENTVLHLYRVGNSEPEIVISCISPNFHPGYDAFRRIVWEKCHGVDTNPGHSILVTREYVPGPL